MLRHVCSEARVGYAWRLRPPVDALPGLNGDMVACEAEGTRVVAILLADLHQHHFLHEALASVYRRFGVPDVPGQRRLEVGTLRAWLGMDEEAPLWPPNLALEVIEPGSYEVSSDTVSLEFVDERALQDLQERLRLELTQTQRFLLRRVKEPFVRWDLVAGASKTTLLFSTGYLVMRQNNRVFFLVVDQDEGDGHRCVSHCAAAR